jgi:hypothetical protein
MKHQTLIILFALQLFMSPISANENVTAKVLPIFHSPQNILYPYRGTFSVDEFNLYAHRPKVDSSKEQSCIVLI